MITDKHISDLFDKEANCLLTHYKGKKIVNRKAMTKEVFVKVVRDLLNESSSVMNVEDSKSILEDVDPGVYTCKCVLCPRYFFSYKARLMCNECVFNL